jgi:peptidoglycan/LPS O-acetylase OafA/YrhL
MPIKDYMADISKYRSHIMGFCILEVILLHSSFQFPGALNYVRMMYWAVDIFFFLSGLGIYHSLSRNSEIVPFYRRRFMRIYPAYLPMLLLYFIPVLIKSAPEGSIWALIQQFLGNIFLLGWINGLDNQFNWYPQAIFITYLLSPVLYFIVKSCHGSGRKLFAVLAFFIVSQLCFFGSGVLVAYSRSIAFILGLISADMAVRNKDFRLNLPVVFVLFIIGNCLAYYTQRMPEELIWSYGICWYPGILVIPGAMLLLCLFFRLCSRVGWLHWVSDIFDSLGRHSFEIFLVQEVIYEYIDKFNLPMNNNFICLIILFLICAAGLLYGKLVSSVLNRRSSKA